MFDVNRVLSTPSTSLLGKALRLPLRLIPRSTVVRVRRGLNRGMKWRVGASTHGCWLGTYEAGKQEAIARLAKRGMNVLDIGANAGFYSLAFSRLCAEGHVWAFEPYAENVQNLLFHLRVNCVENVTAIAAAVSDRTGLAAFRSGENNAMGALSEAGGNLSVATMALDDLVPEWLPIPDIVKIDIEGGEYAALRGAARLLGLRRTTWLVALDDPQRRDDCRRLLASAGYAVIDLGSDAEIVAAPPGVDGTLRDLPVESNLCPERR